MQIFHGQAGSLEEIMIMAAKWMVYDGAFNDDGASATSSPIWMIGMVDSKAGDSKTHYFSEYLITPGIDPDSQKFSLSLIVPLLINLQQILLYLLNDLSCRGIKLN
jgi:hypothetical protein